MMRMCDRFHCLPSQIEKEDASLIRMLIIESRGTREEEFDGG